MAGPASRRPAARNRLAAGFVASLPGALRELAALLGPDATGETRDSAAAALSRMADTADALDQHGVSDAAARAAARVLAGELPGVLDPLVREVRDLGGAGPFAPVAFVGTTRQCANLRGQDDGAAEPLLTFTSVEALLAAMQVEWPQAVVLPTSAGTDALQVAGALGCPVYLYGPSRDDAGRRVAARVGAAGYLPEPLALAELMSHVRYHAALGRRPATVALLGELPWADRTAGTLEAAGLLPVWFEGAAIGSVLHGLYPDAVVLGPGPGRRESLAVARQHIGRTHVALIAVGDPTDPALYAAGADDVLGPHDELAPRVLARLERFRDLRRDRDELTHLPNRAGALEGLHRWVAWGARARSPIAAGLVAADGLTAVAARHGREAGNACRRHLAAALERGLRRHDLVGALGGDVFLAVLPACRAAEAERRMSEIKAAFEERVHADRRLRDVVFAVGVADTEAGAPGLLLRAQGALDLARAGR